MATGRLRHLGIAVQNPYKTADFHIKAFGMRKIGELRPDHVGRRPGPQEIP